MIFDFGWKNGKLGLFSNILSSKDITSLGRVNQMLSSVKDNAEALTKRKTDPSFLKVLDSLSPAARKAAEGLDGTSDSLERAINKSAKLGNAFKSIGYSLLNAFVFWGVSALLDLAVKAIDEGEQRYISGKDCP